MKGQSHEEQNDANIKEPQRGAEWGKFQLRCISSSKQAHTWFGAVAGRDTRIGGLVDHSSRGAFTANHTLAGAYGVWSGAVSRTGRTTVSPQLALHWAGWGEGGEGGGRGERGEGGRRGEGEGRGIVPGLNKYTAA